MKFRKKPLVIEAIQFLGASSVDEMADAWGQSFIYRCTFFAGSQIAEMDMTIKTLEGNHRALIGDWIIRGIKGEFYRCEKEIFEATYEKAEE